MLVIQEQYYVETKRDGKLLNYRLIKNQVDRKKNKELSTLVVELNVKRVEKFHYLKKDFYGNSVGPERVWL